MNSTSLHANGSPVEGLLVLDLYENTDFLKRRRPAASVERQIDGLRQLAQSFVSRPDSILQELAKAAVDLCNADSAGVTLETRDEVGNLGLKWVAVAGEFSHFTDACFPAVNTACGTGIERARPQLFRMGQAFYDSLGIQAKPVTDGILIPWRASTLRGTVWIMAHERTEAFDANDSRLMETLASFAAMAFRQQRQQKVLVDQASAAAAAAMANELAHSINNPLQSLTNLLYLAANDDNPLTTRELAEKMSEDLERLSSLVKTMLALPVRRFTSKPADSAEVSAA